LPTKHRAWPSALSSVLLTAATAVSAPERDLQDVREDLGPDAVHGFLEQHESLARAFLDRGDQPAPCGELLD
jgi:hypothetical protein